MKSRDFSRWMLSEAASLFDEAQRLQRRFFYIGAPADVRSWEPPVDVIETDDAVVINVALPGVAADEVAVSLEPGVLTISARRAFPAPEAAHIHRLEIPYGRFERRISVPLHALELTGKRLANGCLTLTFNKKEQP
jgi:HSP20 family molecular chaperone IbpA